MKKVKKSIFLILSSLIGSAFLIGTNFLISNNKNTIISKNDSESSYSKTNFDKELKNDISLNNHKSQKNGMDGNFVVHSGNKFPLINGFNENYYSTGANAKGITAGANGILVPFMSGLRYIDANNGQIKWTVQDDIWIEGPPSGLGNAKLGDINNYRKVITSYYLPSLKCFLTVSTPGRASNNIFVISVIEESNGKVHSNWFQGNFNLNNLQFASFMIEPVLNTSDNCFIIFPGFYTDKNNRNEFTRKIWVNSDYTFRYQKCDIYNGYNDNNKHVIMSAGFYYDPGIGDTWVLNTLWESKNQWTICFNEGTYDWEINSYTTSNSFSEDQINNFIIGPTNVTGMYLDKWGDDNYEYAYIYCDYTDTQRNNKLVYGKFRNNSHEQPIIVSLQDALDWDICSGRIIKNNQNGVTAAYLYTSWTSTNQSPNVGNKFIRVRLDLWNLNETLNENTLISSSIDNENGPDERVSVWTPVTDKINDQYPIPIPLMNDNLYSKLFYGYDNISNFNNVSCINIENTSSKKESGWSTDIIDSNFSFNSNENNVLSSSWDLDRINKEFNNRMSSIFTRYSDASFFDFSSNNIEYKEDIGEIWCHNPTLRYCFSNDGEYINSRTWNTTLKITGFKQKNTIQKLTEISAKNTDLAAYSPYELANVIGTGSSNYENDFSSEKGIIYNKIIQFIYDKRLDIFENFNELSPNQNVQRVITLIVKDGTTYAKVLKTTSDSITFTFSINQYWKNGIIVNDWGKSNGQVNQWKLTITGLTNKDTRISSAIQTNGIDASEVLSNYTSEQISNALQSSDSKEYIEIKNAIKEFIFNPNNNIFEYLPESTNKEMLFGLSYVEIIDKSIDYITFKFTISPIYLNGTIVDDGNPNINKHFEIKIKSLTNLNTIQSKDIILDASESSFAGLVSSSVTNEEIQEFITKKIISGNYFLDLPNLDNQEIIIKNRYNDVEIGEIYIEFYLPKFYFKNQLIENTTTSINSNSIVYSATIISLNNTPIQWDLNIVANDNKNQINPTYGSDNYLDVKLAAKNKLYEQIQINKSKIKNADDALEYINSSNFIDETIFKYENISSSNSTFNLILKSNKLYEITNISIFLTGMNFNFSNIKYVQTIVNISNPVTNITYEQYLENNNLVNFQTLGLQLINAPTNLYTNNELDPNKLILKLIDIDSSTGNAIFEIIFTDFYLDNGYIQNYKYSFNFKFAPSIFKNNYLKDEIIANNTYMDSFALNQYLNNKNNLQKINNYLNTHKKELLIKDINIDLTFISASLDNADFNNIILIIKIGDFKNESIKITNLKQINIEKTEIDLKQNISKSFEDIKTNNFIWSDVIDVIANTKTPLNEPVKVIDQKVQISPNENVVFIRFKFNGIYLNNNINSFKLNYEIIIKVTNLNNINTLWQFVDNTNLAMNNTENKISTKKIIILSLIPIGILLLTILLTIIILKLRGINNEKK